MGSKAVIEKLFALPMGGDFDALTTVLGDIFDEVDADIDNLLLEASATTADETLQQWLDDYGLAFDAGDSTAWKRQVLLAKLNELGGLSIPYYVNHAARFDEVVSIRDSLVFKFGDRFGGKFYGAEHVHSFILALKDQHRFPFKFGDKFGAKFVSYDKRNSMEEMFLRLKPAHTKIFFKYFNWDFETGDLSEWIAFDDVIDNVTVRSGAYSAKLVADGSVQGFKGLVSYLIIIADNRKYRIDSWHNILVYVEGEYLFLIEFFSDFYGQESAGTFTIYSKQAATAGWEQGLKTIAPADIASDIDIPATAKSFTLLRGWQDLGGFNPDGDAYIDDIDVSLV